jgi:Big-like domain-containing protein
VAHRLDSMTRYWGKVATGLVLGAMVAYACITDTAIGPDVALDSLYIEPASSIIVIDDTLRLTAVGVDSTGRRFTLTLVTWSTTNSEIELTPSGTVIALTSGTATVTAAAGTKAAMAMVAIQPKPILATSLDSVAFTAFVNGPDPADQSVIITNSGGGTLEPALDSITYGPGASGWLNTALSGTTLPDTLVLDVLTSGLAVGSYRATLSLSSPGATNSPETLTVTLDVGLGPPSTIVADSGNGQAATVNTAVAIAPVARVLDPYNNPLSGIAVTFTVTGGGGSITPTTSVATNAAGRARLTTWTLGTGSGPNTVQASVAGVTPTTFTATGVAQTDVSPTQSSAVATTGAITACSSSCSAGSTASTITVTVRDGFGNPIANAAVTMTGSGTNNVFSPASGTANASGVFTSTFSSTKAELKTISATANGGSGSVPISQSAAVTVGAASPASVTVTNAGFSTRVGAAVAPLPTYTVRDAFSNLVPNFAVSYTSSNSGAFGGPSTTNGSGQATLTSWTMSGAAADDASGRMANQVTLQAGSATATATDYGIYTWLSDVKPVIGGPPPATTCSGCHNLERNPNNIVGVASSCAGWNYVVAGSAASSYVYTKMAGTPACGGNAMPPPGGSSAANLKIVRAWINNGAQNN